MRRYIIPFIIVVTVLFRASSPVEQATKSTDRSNWNRPPVPHDCYVCDETGCHWAACPWGK